MFPAENCLNHPCADPPQIVCGCGARGGRALRTGQRCYRIDAGAHSRRAGCQRTLAAYTTSSEGLDAGAGARAVALVAVLVAVGF